MLNIKTNPTIIYKLKRSPSLFPSFINTDSFFQEKGSNPSPWWLLALAQRRFLPPPKEIQNKSKQILAPGRGLPQAAIWRRCHHASPPTDPTQPTEIIEHMTFLYIQHLFRIY